MSLLKFIKPGT